MIKFTGETRYKNPDKSRQNNTKDQKIQTNLDKPDLLRKMQLFQRNPDQWEPCGQNGKVQK